MDANLKAQWLTALRSGEYKQGKFALRDSEGGYCCLGVLCDVIDPNGWDDGDLWHAPARMLTDSGGDDENVAYSGHLIPEAIAESLLGLDDNGSPNQNGILDFTARTPDGYDDTPQALSSLNDYGFTFAQIADVIENKF